MLTISQQRQLSTDLRACFAANRLGTLTLSDLREELSMTHPHWHDRWADMDAEQAEMILYEDGLRKLANEGWLKRSQDGWSVLLDPSRCSGCFHPIGEHDLVDIEGNRFCGWPCTESFYLYADPYESGVDLYHTLVDAWRSIGTESKRLRHEAMTESKDDHARLVRVRQELQAVLEDSGRWPEPPLPGEESLVAREAERIRQQMEKEAERLDALARLLYPAEGCCSACGLLVGLDYLCHESGALFCSEECQEEADPTPDCSVHPYEDDYMAIRYEYLETLRSWKQELEADSCPELRLEALCEGIDSVVQEFRSFLNDEGADGKLAYEIYRHIRKLADLQSSILTWRPERQPLYWFRTGLGYFHASDHEEEGQMNAVMISMLQEGLATDVIDLLQTYRHPCHGGFNMVFERLEDAEEVFQVLSPLFRKHDVEVNLQAAYRCEAGCGDIVDDAEERHLDGWFYCDHHVEQEIYGIFSEEKLREKLDFFASNDKARQSLIEERYEDDYLYKLKIARSCRRWAVERPDWADDLQDR